MGRVTVQNARLLRNMAINICVKCITYDVLRPERVGRKSVSRPAHCAIALETNDVR